MFLNKTCRNLRWNSFLKDEVKGAIALEGALLLPFFVLIFVAMTTFFQVNRVDSSYIHAATTLGDLATRQIEITDSTADNLFATAESLVISADNFMTTMTSVSYNVAEDEYFVNWSSSNIDGQELEDEDIVGYDFPRMEETESVMLVVVRGSVTPLFDGIFGTEVDLEKHAIRRPRFVRLVDRKP